MAVSAQVARGHKKMRNTHHPEEIEKIGFLATYAGSWQCEIW